ncbi:MULTISPECIES: hypothetical protein [unclassified Leucobacter]|uniref:hypothetical protein n=1 Tax=unclassified Leucobacter TaxID=2621730 RepID=UPI00165D64E0|nr:MULTISPECIES: hypothetical protein [unclassified Leucobacter]MBC9927462.1 hypothetical protein [Leucobacter sp. cx-169]
MMTIAIDTDDMQMLRGRLRDAAGKIADAVPQMPGSAAFGPAVLGAAVVSFESAMRQKADELQERWSKLETGVRETYDDMSKVESDIIAKLQRVEGRPE